MNNIDSEFNFNTQQKYVLKNYKNGLDEYKNNLEKAIKLESYPIFLDTNVLLNSYEISIRSRVQLLSVFKNYKDRIYVTKNCEREFIKNRFEVQARFEDIQSKIESEFKDSVLNKIYDYKNQKKSILSDYPEFYQEIEKSEETLKHALEKIKESINENIKRVSEINFQDDFLEIFTEFQITEELNETEIKFIKEQFDILKKTDINFPGKADVKKKPENPYGDFIIFHELLKYSKNYKTHIIFLTNDSSKGDWFVDKSGYKKTIVEYVNIFYKLTGQIIYILEANKIINSLLTTDLIKIVSSQNSSNNIQIPQKKLYLPDWAEIQLKLLIEGEYSHEFPLSLSHIDSLKFEIENVDINELLETGNFYTDLKGSGVVYYFDDEDESRKSLFKNTFDFHGSISLDLKYETIESHQIMINAYYD